LARDEPPSSGKWKNYLTRWRWYPVPAVYLSMIMAFYFGATTIMSDSDASALTQLGEEFIKEMMARGAIGIFINNYIYSLVMIAPFIGMPFGMYTIYNTGLLAAAQIQTSMNVIDPSARAMVIILTVISPIGIMEFISYALSMTQGLLLIYAILKRHIKDEVMNAAITAAIVLVILISAAFLEFEMVKGFYNP